VTTFLLVSVVVAAVVAGYLLRSSGKSGGGSGAAQDVPPRPKFKDFRHTGKTYEESYDNYLEALEKWQTLTGRE